jgi:hypothetical protein
MPVTASYSLSSRREWWVGEEQCCDGEGAVKASVECGGGGGESARVVDLSSEESNMYSKEIRA